MTTSLSAMRVLPIGLSIWILTMSSTLGCEMDGSTNNPYCNPCGYRKMIPESHYDVELSIPTRDDAYTCHLLEERSRQGYVPSACCIVFQAFTKRKCGCIPKPKKRDDNDESEDVDRPEAEHEFYDGDDVEEDDDGSFDEEDDEYQSIEEDDEAANYASDEDDDEDDGETENVVEDGTETSIQEDKDRAETEEEEDGQEDEDGWRDEENAGISSDVRDDGVDDEVSHKMDSEAEDNIDSFEGAIEFPFRGRYGGGVRRRRRILNIRHSLLRGSSK